jgi:transcription elongation factor Elf1
LFKNFDFRSNSATMPAARTNNYQGSRLKAPSRNGILNNRARVTKAASVWKSSSKESATNRFDCVFCEHESSVVVKLEKKAHRGQLDCKVCGQHFETSGPHLFAAVDVFCEWSDACDPAAKEEYERKQSEKQQPQSGRQWQLKSQVGPSICRQTT